MRKPISLEQSYKIYSILVICGGAQDSFHSFMDFVHHYTSPDPPTEWRFMGKLAFGGKLRYGSCGGQLFHVDCYREDETPERRKLIDEINQKLKPISDEVTTIQEDAIRARFAK